MVERNNDIGRVISRFGAELILATQDGEHIRCTTRRKLDNAASGDYVRWQKEAQGNAVVTAIEPRKNVLSRPDFRGKIRVIAANIDVLIVVSSWRPQPSWEMLDRYLVAAEQLPAEVIIVMNKADLRVNTVRLMMMPILKNIAVSVIRLFIPMRIPDRVSLKSAMHWVIKQRFWQGSPASVNPH